MSTVIPPARGDAIAGAWAGHAPALADWALARLVVRRDVFGAYKPDGGQFTARGPLTAEVLVRHFEGGRSIGLHSTSPDNLCKAAALDIDAHDDEADPGLNWRCALRAGELFADLGLTALIIDSNGKGGYHVRTFFKKPVPAEVAHWLGARVVAILKSEGFEAVAIESFPKQGGVTLASPYGNWLRLPGRHHKRPHWTRIHDPETGRWLAGEAAVRRLIAVAGDDTRTLLAAYEAERAAREGDGRAGRDPGAARAKDGGRKADEETVREALGYLPGAWADSYGGTRTDTGWLGVGMALHDWDSSRGLALWDEFSRRSSKYQAGACEAKWGTFAQGGGLGVGSIFHEAEKNGWESPWAKARARRTKSSHNGHHAGNGRHAGDGTAGPAANGDVEAGPGPSANGKAGAADELEKIAVEDRFPERPKGMFHGLAGDFVGAIDPLTEADPAAILIQTLIMFGNIIRRGPYWTTNETRHYTNMYAVVVGMTSTARKGTGGNIVKDLYWHVEPDWVKGCVKGGTVSGEGLIYHVRDQVVKDGKVVDEGVSDKRLMLVEDEFSSVLKAGNRDGNTTSNVLRKFWDCGESGTLAKNSTNVATGAHVSLLGHATIADIRKYLYEVDSFNGTGNRLLWIASRRTKLIPIAGRLDSRIMNDFVRRFREAVEFARAVGEMPLTRDGEQFWLSCYEELTADRPGLLGAILARNAPQVRRAAAIYALLDLRDEVDAAHLAAALALWEYNVNSCRLIFGDAVGDADADKLIAALRAAPAGLTRTQIANDVFAKNRPAARIGRILSDLLTGGLIHRRPVSTGGRPAETWFAGGSHA